MDDELRLLLIDELDKQLVYLDAGATADEQRRAVHTLKGSLGLAGERGLAEAFTRIERRMQQGEAEALGDATRLAMTSLAALRENRPIPQQYWPEPPDDLVPAPIDASLAHGYLETVRDRLARLDGALASNESEERIVGEVFRDVHTLKGAALSVGDEIMAWFCHGLEERLRLAQTSDAAAKTAVEELPQYRAVMAEIALSPENALYTLRLLVRATRPSVRPPIDTPLPLPPKRPSMELRPESEARALSEEGSVRVGTATLDRLFERVGQLAQVRGPLSGNVGRLSRGASSARDVHRQLREALRLIGPPRPWGAPALAIDKIERGAGVLIDLAKGLEKASDDLRTAGSRVARESEAMQLAVTGMRTTHASRLFGPVSAAIFTQARREGKDVNVVVQGGETPIDRRLAEALADPITQLARNAVAHGLESPDARANAKKPRLGTITLRAQLRAGSLFVEVEDDGAGVDIPYVRRRAIETGTVAAEVAESLPDRTLLSLLFLPGFTTRTSADLLAGRGVGLDLTLAAVHRMGGTIQLSTRTGRGLVAAIAVPSEGALVKVAWLEWGKTTFALPLVHAGRVSRAAEAQGRIVPLSRYVGAAAPARGDGAPAFALEVLRPAPQDARASESGVPFLLGVDGVAGVEEVALRALSPLVRLSGPYAAGIVWGDELRLSLDPEALLAL